MGLARWMLAKTSAHSLRATGALVTLLAGGVTLLSLSTEMGLTVGATNETANATSTTAATATVTSLSADALVAFTSAHPAYPLALAFGLLLLVFGDDVPLLGD